MQVWGPGLGSKVDWRARLIGAGAGQGPDSGSGVGCRFGGLGLAGQGQARLWVGTRVRVQARGWIKWFGWRCKGQGPGLESGVRL